MACVFLLLKIIYFTFVYATFFLFFCEIVPTAMPCTSLHPGRGFVYCFPNKLMESTILFSNMVIAVVKSVLIPGRVLVIKLMK